MNQTAAKLDSPGESETELIRRYDRKIQGIARRFPLHRDDLEQVGRLALLDAAKQWQGSAQFWTYARKCIRLQMIRFYSRERNRPGIELESELAPQPTLAPDVFLEAHELIKDLPEQEARMLAMYIEGEDIRTIAEQLGMRKSTTSDALQGTLKKLRDSA